MKLYTVTIRGRKYYFFGDLTPKAIQASERYCLDLELNNKNTHHAKLFDYLVKYIESTLGFTVIPISIEHIFRINY
ncbi:MAG: hypothetical protein J6S23_08490 [Clostridia bacterium]|nr:hypothetical protein [Clostridia bacterium]